MYGGGGSFVHLLISNYQVHINKMANKEEERDCNVLHYGMSKERCDIIGIALLLHFTATF